MRVEKIIDSIDQEPYYREKEGVLYCADCMDILPQIPEKSIDLVLTDPPYGVNLKYDIYDDSDENWIKMFNNIIPLLKRISIRPNSEITSSTSVKIESSMLTFNLSPIAFGLSRLSFLATDLQLFTFLEAITTLAPASANASEIAVPRCPAPPVTIATFPFKSKSSLIVGILILLSGL